MLTAKDQRYNYLLFSFFSAIVHLPYHFDRQNVRLIPQKSLLRKVLWWIFCINAAMSVSYQSIRLIWILFIRDELVNLQYLVAHLVFGVADPYFIVSTVFLFLQQSELTAAIFNEVAGFVSDREEEENAREKFLKTTAGAVCSTQLVMMIIVTIMYDSPQFYYSELPTALHGNIFVIVFTLAYESFTNLYLMCILFFTNFTQAAFFNATSRRLQIWLDDLRQRQDELQLEDMVKGCGRCRRTQLSVSRFNMSFAGVLFTFKLAIMSVAIFGFTFSIKFNTERPLLAGISTFYGFEGLIMFTMLYNDVFRIPDYVDDMKTVLRLSSMKLADPVQTKQVKRMLKSIPQVGVKVGSFRFLERESTLIFIDFIANQVASLLIGLES